LDAGARGRGHEARLESAQERLTLCRRRKISTARADSGRKGRSVLDGRAAGPRGPFGTAEPRAHDGAVAAGRNAEDFDLRAAALDTHLFGGAAQDGARAVAFLETCLD